MDESTGVTITRGVTPFLLYQENSARAAYARNYVQMGPVEVNKSGHFEYYLWMGIWSTMRTVSPSTQRAGFESITLLVNGEPLALDVAGWTPAAIGVSQPLFVRPVSSASDAFYRVTFDQIRLLATSTDIRLRPNHQSTFEYQLWDAQQAARQSFQAFMSAANY